MNQARFVTSIWPWNREGKDATTPQDVRSGEGAGLSQLEALAAALPDPCIVLDPEGRIIASNEKARDTLSPILKGQHLSTAIRSPAVLDALTRSQTSGSLALVDYEARGPTPRHFEVFISPMRPADGPAAILLLLRDLTREQRIERLRADFVANASHELRTPLASLMGFIETLQGAAKNDEKARTKFLDLMKSQAERMKRLIDDLLSLSQIEMSEHVPPVDRIDLSQVAQHVSDILSALAETNGAAITLKTEPGLLVVGEWDELVQVVQNLVENAIKYGSSGKLIEVSTARHNGHVELSVRDHGPGIEEEHLPRLTERFYRVNIQDSRARGGTGLGLAIVKHILNRHRGRLVVQSKKGEGSVFTIRLPAPDISSKN
jgi:two-component system phosphate regulon sensor histidine kinase PhoR